MDGQPGDKSPGYYRVSLRDEVKTGFQNVQTPETLRARKNATQKSRPVGYGVIRYEGRRRGGLGRGAKQIRDAG
jgi:hypothetical protein